jgi:hypothetical protein
MKTLQSFISQSHLDESLIRAVVSQFDGFESFSESAQDVANHGINGGFHGFIYYSDTVKFAETNKQLIIDYARKMANELGEDGAYSLIASFVCLNDMNADLVADAINNLDHEDNTQVMNAMSWFAGEEVCRSYCDILEQAA